jgi:prepilin-type N-terminal cleavage/methylation domain-containing protein
MMRRRKDSGFTLIELMIVIAVIGILAIVLVPRVGLVKSQAKETGLDTNIRTVQGYVESRIDKWALNNANASDIIGDIQNAFTFNDTERQLVNPFTSVPKNVTTGASIVAGDTLFVKADTGVPHPNATENKGVVVVRVDDDPLTVVIDGYNINGKVIDDKRVTIKP